VKALERFRAALVAVRDLFSVERQMSDEARTGWESWLEETDPVKEGFVQDVRGQSDR
jgi:hypothetical protein